MSKPKSDADPGFVTLTHPTTHAAWDCPVDAAEGWKSQGWNVATDRTAHKGDSNG